MQHMNNTDAAAAHDKMMDLAAEYTRQARDVYKLSVDCADEPERALAFINQANLLMERIEGIFECVAILTKEIG